MPYVQATVVIPTFNGRRMLVEALEGLERQTTAHDVIVVDNGSTDGTVDLLAERFPHVRVVELPENVGFGRAVNRGVAAAETDVVVLINNDVVCEPEFLERLLEPLGDDSVAMVAGVLLQHDRPHLVDSAGIELDTTLRSWDALWNRPVSELAGAAEPVGPCGGAAAFRTRAFRDVGGFDETFFAYWEDVDLALRLRLAGHRCVRAGDGSRSAQARADARRGVTGAAAARGVRPRATCSRATGSRGGACRPASRSRCSTGPSSSSTCSFAGRPDRSARARAAPGQGSRSRRCARRSSSRRSASARRSVARRCSCGCAPAAHCRRTSTRAPGEAG